MSRLETSPTQSNIERRLLAQVFFEIAKQCSDLQELVWFEQDLIRTMCEGDDEIATAHEVTILIQGHVNRAWKRVESQWRRQRAALQLAIFDDDYSTSDRSQDRNLNHEGAPL